MPRHFSKKGDLKKFKRSTKRVRARKFRTQNLFEDIRAEEFLCSVEKKPQAGFPRIRRPEESEKNLVCSVKHTNEGRKVQVK